MRVLQPLLSGGAGSPSGAVPYSTRVNLVSVPVPGSGKRQELALAAAPRPACWPPRPPALNSPQTIVVGFTGVLDLQGPLARGVLIPGMRCHEGPVIKPISRVVVRPGEKGAHSSEASGGPQPEDTTPTTHESHGFPQCSETPGGQKCLLALFPGRPDVHNQKILEPCKGAIHGKARYQHFMGRSQGLL